MKKTLTILLVLICILGYSQSRPDTLTYGSNKLKIVSSTGDIITTGAISLGSNATGTSLFIKAGTSAISPIKIGNGDLLINSAAGNIEYKDDDWYLSIVTPQPAAVQWFLPVAQSSTYVKATSLGWSCNAEYATDTTLSVIGSALNNSWQSAYNPGVNAPQRFHIDIGSAQVIDQVYYENLHDNGSVSNAGVQNYTLWGSNDASAFADLIYANDTNWTQITGVSQTHFEQHTASDIADPQYIYITPTAAYRYYAFKFADNYGYDGLMGLRRIALQYTGAVYRRGVILNDGQKLTQNVIPVATTNGRLIDGMISQDTIRNIIDISGSIFFRDTLFCGDSTALPRDTIIPVDIDNYEFKKIGVGIPSNTANYLLQVNGASDNVYSQYTNTTTGTTSTDGFKIGLDSATTAVNLTNYEATSVVVKTSNTERLRITEYGGQVWKPVNTGNITAGTGITAAMLSYDMRYNGGSAIDITAVPQIVDGYDGQEIKIIGLSDVNTLTLDEGNGLSLQNGISFILTAGSIIHFTYIASLDIWSEDYRSPRE